MTWTPPYYGVSHLLGLPPGYQITLSDYGTFTDIYCIDRYSERPLTRMLHETRVSTVEEAKKLGEEWAKLLPDRPKRIIR